MLPWRIPVGALLVVVAACNDPVGPGTSRPWGPGQILGGGSGGTTSGTVASITIAPTSVVLARADSVRLVATALDQSGLAVTNATFAWSSSDVRIARVHPDANNSAVAVVSAIALGTVTITSSSGAASGTATVTVISSP